MKFLVPLLLIIIHPSILPVAAAADILYADQTLADGQTLVSSGQTFELGFFSLAANTSGADRYFGIWYKSLPPTYIWVANRNNPVGNSSSSAGQASLRIAVNGSVSVQNGLDSVWSVVPTKAVNGAFLQLLDNGNLVLMDNSSSSSSSAGEEYLWQSFDYITDTLLPGMKLGWNIATGLVRNMTSWSSSTDPSTGDYSFSLDPPETPQLILRKGTQKMYRWGPWDGVRFSGSSELRANPVFEPMFNSSTQDVYYSYKVLDASLLSRFIVTTDGLIQYLSWRNDTQQWVNMITLQRDECDEYGRCGPYGSCYGGNVVCKCLKGFVPSSPQNWNSLDWTGGCTRKWELNCGNGTFSDGFVKYKNLQLPDNSRLASNTSSSLKECETKCLENCSCTAYTRIDIHGNGGDCVLWFGDLVDMKNYPDGGDVLYVRMARAELDAIADAKRRRLIRLILGITLPVICGMLCLGLAGWYIVRKRRDARRGERLYYNSPIGPPEQDLELPLFDLQTVSTATGEFSSQNKIGQGGFGPVYLGVLPLGQEIAVKRLSLSSRQGIDEFKNEVKLIAKLQHRNLVKLLGCCIHEEERMLIYEYMPNKSLDYHVFDQARGKLLSWKKRFDIIKGIARGLLYLHQDSRLRIIHRDLKPSNILLDSGMIPKISDFGIARTFQGEQTCEKTKRVFGTYGYIAPEYALRGHISVKSDVFSFGVLVLEIISGKRIMGFSHPEYDLNLLGYAWKLWNERNPLDILDEKIDEPFSRKEVVRCIKVAMLCAQLRAEDRPMMHSVVVMLGNENVDVPEPKEPGFNVESIFMGTDSSSSAKDVITHSDITVTTLEGR